MDILIDFDGTCVTHNYPYIGEDIGAVPVLKKIVENGHNIILFTLRSNKDGKNYLQDAVDWFKKNSIPLYGINTNPTQKTWTSSPKAQGQLIIDDTGLNIPLTLELHVDWVEVEKLLKMKGIIK